ncbi:hypothetical protein VCHC81A2_3247, partial [Vibrio cholerae HC-81A2]
MPIGSNHKVAYP